MQYFSLLWEFVLLPIAGILGVKWLTARVVESAKGGVSLAVGKALADHGKLISAEIESLKQSLALDKERYSKDSALFAEQRNAIYARTLRRSRLRAVDTMIALGGSYGQRHLTVDTYQTSGHCSLLV